MNWDNLLPAMAAWQRKQFPKATTLSALAHLKKEVNIELTAKPDDVDEWTDALHLVIQGGVKAAGSINEFMRAVEKKLGHNINERAWPAEPDADNVYEHVRLS